MAKKSQDSNDLITEQPAWALISSGLLISFFLGFAIKSYFNPARLSEKISEASQKIHPSVQVKFESAFLSLSRWGIPQLEVVVAQVQAQSSQDCWGRPQIHIDEVRVPLSLKKIFSQEDPIRGIELGAVKVHLTQPMKPCSEQPALEGVKTAPISESPGTRGPIILRGNQRGHGLEFLSIKGIEIHFDYEPRYYTELKSIQLKVIQNSPLRVTLDARTELFKNEVVGDYLSNSRLRVEYDESQDQSVLVHFFGNFREGYYSLIAKSSLSDRTVRLESELQNIPLGAVLSLMQKYGQSRAQVNANNLWLSLKAQSFFSIDNMKQAGLNISKLMIEGDLLELSSDQVTIHQLEPLSYDPIKVEIKKLNIQKIFEFYGRPHPTKAMGSLGLFKGSAEIRNENEISLVGLLSGLEFIFANQGRRETQVVDSTLLDAQFLSGNWNLKLSNPQLQRGQLIGEINLRADRYLKNISLDVHIDDLQLSPEVQGLMTQGGRIGPLEAELQWVVQNQMTQNMKGQVTLQETEIEGLKLKKATAQVGYVDNSIFVKSRANQIVINKGAPLQVLGSFLSPLERFEFQTAQLDFYVDSANELRWKNTHGTMQDGTQLKTEGGWNSQGELNGSVATQKGKKIKKVWKILGTRSSPIFSIEKEQ